jgi:hypothetical protein
MMMKNKTLKKYAVQITAELKLNFKQWIQNANLEKGKLKR